MYHSSFVFSTIKPPCLSWYGKYETAISIDGKPWRIYRGYDSKEEALKGHEEAIEEIQQLKKQPNKSNSGYNKDAHSAPPFIFAPQLGQYLYSLLL